MTAGMVGRIAEAAPRHKGGGIVSAYYLLAIMAGVFVLFFQSTLAFAGDLIVTVIYIALTILFYGFSKKRLTSENRDRSASGATAQSRKAMFPRPTFSTPTLITDGPRCADREISAHAAGSS